VSDFARGVDMHAVEQGFAARGGTPTGPAIEVAIEMFQTKRLHREGSEGSESVAVDVCRVANGHHCLTVLR
jgi:hypothetical protein